MEPIFSGVENRSQPRISLVGGRDTWLREHVGEHDCPYSPRAELSLKSDDRKRLVSYASVDSHDDNQGECKLPSSGGIRSSAAARSSFSDETESVPVVGRITANVP